MEKDLRIYKELSAAAERVFNEGIKAPSGLYSLAELSKVGTTCKTAPAGVYFREEYNTAELININVDGFECSYPACKAFELAYKFERLAKVGAKARAVFQRAEDHGEAVAIFTVDAVLCDSLAACEDPRKGCHPQLQGVYIDLTAGLACCCDSFALNVSRLVDAQVFNADALTFGGVILSRAFIKGAKGCEVSIYKDGATLCAVASNGASCHEIPEQYPNYKSVFPHVDESAPVRFVKSIRGLKKTAAAVAKAAGCEFVCVSGYNGDDLITISAQGDGGEITRRVALAERLAATFAVACSPIRLKTINNAADTLYIAQDESLVFSGAKCVAMIAPCDKKEILTTTATAADKEKTQLECNYNAFAAFAAPVENVTVEDSDNADKLDVAPVAPADSIQTAESNDNADTLDITPVATADSIQAADGNDNADTLDIATVAPADSIQTAESIDNVDTLHIATVAPADSIQAAESIDNADTLNIAPVAPAYNLYIIGLAKN